MPTYHVIIIGAGAAGMMCAIEAGKRGRSVLLIDHAKNPGEKIRISGGGRCNFTNIHTEPKHFLSSNQKFCISALQRYRPDDFIALVKKYGIAYHEKTLGQLFCDHSSKQIIEMLVAMCKEAGVVFQLSTTVQAVQKQEERFILQTSAGEISSQSLVIASGGLSIPKMGATGFGYEVARQFGLSIIPTRPGLVPFTVSEPLLTQVKNLAGVSASVRVTCAKKSFNEAMLFTHRGISGPAILQISSYWEKGKSVEICFLPECDIVTLLKAARNQRPKQDIQTILTGMLPKRIISELLPVQSNAKMAELSNSALEEIAALLKVWKFLPSGTEGYRTAEVTLGGVDTAEISSQTMESCRIKRLYFIGEVVDVTGHLGGFNFQWAWSSGYVAGQYV